MVLCHGAGMKTLILSLCLVATVAAPAMADPVQVVAATADPDVASWTITATLRHPDTGWDHYADAWEVLAPDGTSLGVRELAHPHVEEQPFTRSLSGVVIPNGLDHVLIRARCQVDGWGDATFRLDLP